MLVDPEFVSLICWTSALFVASADFRDLATVELVEFVFADADLPSERERIEVLPPKEFERLFGVLEDLRSEGSGTAF